jgi:hypothetical protein
MRDDTGSLLGSTVDEFGTLSGFALGTPTRFLIRALEDGLHAETVDAANLLDGSFYQLDQRLENALSK